MNGGHNGATKRTAAATLVLDSKNAKTGPVAVTYASIEATCPAACPFRGEGCYAQLGHVGFTVRRLDRAGATALQAASDEAAAIQGVKHPFGRPLRLHVSGDASTNKAAAFERDGVRWIPCPEQTRGKTCAECRLCWDTESLRACGAGIAFAVHGASKKRVLNVIQ